MRSRLMGVIERVRLTVMGRVQGVGYRMSCAHEAKAIGVDGSVRNLSDGRVEVIAEGTREQLDALAAWCADGPQFASVRQVDRVAETPVGESSFTIR